MMRFGHLATLPFVVALGVSLAHCATATEVVVEVWTDVCEKPSPVGFEAAPTLDELGNGGVDSVSPAEPCVGGSSRRVGSIVLSPSSSADKDSRVAFEVVTASNGGPPSLCTEKNGYAGCIVARRRVSYLPRTQVRLRVDLREACRDVPCGVTETCVRGQCRPAEVTCEGACDEETLYGATPAPTADAGPRDPAPIPDAAVPETGPLALRIEQLVAGADHTCVRWSDHKVTCWGADNQGQASGTKQAPRTPTVVFEAPPGDTLVDLAAGGDTTCVARGTGAVRCWGQLSDGPLSDIVAQPRFVQVALGLRHGCARTAEGQIWCFGDSTLGQFESAGGAATLLTAEQQPGRAPSAELKAATGGNFTCSVWLDRSKVDCWGAPADGKAADSDVLPPSISSFGVSTTRSCFAASAATKATCVPSPFNETPPTIAWAGYGDRLCHLAADGSVSCRLGGVGASLPIPAPNARLLAAGAEHTCVVVGDTTVKCWGGRSKGQVDGTIGTPIVAPATVPLGR